MLNTIPAVVVAQILNYDRATTPKPFCDISADTYDQLTEFAQSTETYRDQSTFSYLPLLVHETVTQHADTDEHVENAARFLADAMQRLLEHEFTTFDCPMLKRTEVAA